jgi:hypothetical protein
LLSVHKYDIILLYQIEKLIVKILTTNSVIIFDEAVKNLIYLGYASRQPKSGSSHITFFKPDFKTNITLVLGQKELKARYSGYPKERRLLE